MQSCSEREWYLSYNSVVSPNKPSKVLRVLNGAATFHGASLNKSLFSGPYLLHNLIYVLLRFRQTPFAVSADISRMFLHVGVLPCDRSSLQFLWRKDPSANVVVHQCTRHIFVENICPRAPTKHFSARQVKMLGNNRKPRKPTVLENFYMDHYLDSVECNRALIRSKDLVDHFHLGGLNFTKIVSNVPALADRIEESAQSSEPKVIVSSTEESRHEFWLRWDYNNDTLVFSKGTNSTTTKSITQRLLVNLVSQVYDPTGLVAP